MNTLDKITKLESKLNALEKMMQAMGEANRQLTDRTGQVLNDTAQKQDLVISKIMSIEQSFATLAKTLNAVVSELDETGKINSNNVVKRIRDMDEYAEAERVRSMLNAGAIAPADLVSENSMLVVAQNLKKQDGEEITVATYRVYELTSPLQTKETVDMFVGKKEGDVVEITTEHGLLSNKIIAIYEHQKMGHLMNEEVEEVKGAEESEQSPVV